MNRYRLKKAFTIAEALIILLAVSLLAVAVVPALTKKHVKIGTHGKWICTVDNNGTHWVATEYKGKMSDFVNTGASCSFAPPANAQYISIKAVGGGGAGAMGEAGNEETIFQSESKGEVFVKSVSNDGYYYVTAVGGGGSGGGIGCGNYSDHYIDPSTLFIEDGKRDGIPYYTSGSSSFFTNDKWWNKDTQSFNEYKNEDIKDATPSGIVYPESVKTKKYTYGYVYKAYSGYNYPALVKNDNRYSETKDESKIKWLNEKLEWQSEVPIEEFKYHHLPADMQRDYQVCFPTGYSKYALPFSKKYNFLNKEVEGMYVRNPEGEKNAICWNLPSQGGKAGSLVSKSVYISGGENIVVTTGRGGKGQKDQGAATVKDYDNKTYTATVGKAGENGTETIVTVGANHFTAAGGAGGYGRQLKKNVSFVNIPLQICEIQKTTANFANANPACSKIKGEDNSGTLKNKCEATTNCSAYRRRSSLAGFKGCYGTNTDSNKRCSAFGESNCAGSHKYTTTEKDDEGNDKDVEHSYRCDAIYNYYTSCSSTGTHEGPKYVIGPCENVIKSSYFGDKNISACVSTSSTSMAGDIDKEVTADEPGIYGTSSTSRRIWISEDDDKTLELPEAYLKVGMGYGSGGYGIGITSASYLAVKSTGYSFNKAMRFHGYDGEDGYADVKRVSYTAGGGGQAGQYISTNLKKTGKLSIKVGKGGVGIVDNRAGNDGEKTVIKQIVNGQEKTLFEMKGGKGGIAPATKATMASGKMAGIDGALSPFESPYNKARIIPLGGFSSTNNSPNGISPATPKWIGTNNQYGSYLLMTYGAGGGGGGASKTESGGGGNGAPGAVVIEW